LKNEIDKLIDEITRLTDASKTNKDESLSLKQKLQQTEDERYNLSKKRDDLEKDLANLQFQSGEDRERGKRELDNLIKKIEESERELNDEISN